MKVRHFVIKITTIFLLAVMAVPVQAGHSWGNYHWARSSNPLLLDLGDNLTSTWTGHLEQASGDWNLSDVLNTSIIDGSTSARRCKAQAGNVQVCNLRYGNNGWLGIAGISISGGHITAGYVKLNDTYFDSGSYNTDDWRQMVTCQEVGHTFGLDHQDENFGNGNLNTCMDYTSLPSSNTMPNTHDYEQLESIYNHTEGGGGDGGGCNPRSPKCNPGASAADVLAGMDSNGPAHWGRLISEHGPQEVYEMNLGGGRKILTHVTWTLERANDHEH